ncbi:MAG: hypothetical protein KC503_13830, partial [Myxococcales bacterium]|nr:hypothetical protein [Myxococcales bacterium]
VAGSFVSQHSEMHYADSGEMALSLVAGDMLGAGIGLLANTSRPNILRLMQGVGLATWIGGGLRAPHTRYSTRDAFFVTQMTLGGAVQGTFLPDVWRDDVDGPPRSTRLGGAMLGAGLGLVAGSIIAQHSELRFADTVEGAVGLLAGDLFGGGLGMLADLSRRNTLRIAQSVGAAAWLAAALRAPHTRYSPRDALHISQLVGVGALHGAMLPDLWRGDHDAPSSLQRVGGVLAGASLALAAGSLLAQRTDTPEADVGESTAVLAGGHAFAAGLSLVAGFGRANTLRTMLGAGLGSYVAGSLLAPYTRYRPRDAALMALTSGYGALLGGFAPVWRHGRIGASSSGQVGGGMLAGASVGLAAGAFAAQIVDTNPRALAEVGFIGAGSGLFGAGLGMMIPYPDDRLPIGLMQGLGIAGTLLSAPIIKHTQYRGTDRLLTTLAVGFGAWQGTGAALMLNASRRQVAGAVMATAGLGGLAGAAISQGVSLTQGELWTLFSGSVWGGTVAAFATNVARLGRKLSTATQVGVTMIASDVGLGLSALALSPALRMPAERLGWINLFGLGGTAVGVAIGAPIRSDTGTQIGVVAGSLVGLVSGVIATGYMRFSDHVALGVDGDMALARSSHGPRTTRRASGGRARTAAPPSASSGRLPSFIADWAPTVSMQPGIDPHTGGATGGDGALIFGVRGRLH